MLVRMILAPTIQERESTRGLWTAEWPLSAIALRKAREWDEEGKNLIGTRFSRMS
jgi:hypothetical protein